MQIPHCRIVFLGLFLFASSSLQAQYCGLLGIQQLQLSAQIWNTDSTYSIPVCPLNNLNNPGLEQGLDSWYGGGELTIESHEDYQAIQSCHTFEAAFQTIKAEPNQDYTLRVFAKKDANASGTISMKFLNADFVPIHQEFHEIKSSTYELLHLTAMGAAQTAFIEVNIFQDGGEGCVYADDWCLSKGEAGKKYCKTTEALLRSKYQTDIEDADIKQPVIEQLSQRTQMLQALAQHKAVIELWESKLDKKLKHRSKAYQIVYRYIFSRI